MENWERMAGAWMQSANSLVPRFAEPGSESHTLEPGQVWRARWDDVVSMVFVDSRVGGFRNLVRVAPVTVGNSLADNLTVILPAEATSLSISLSVWTELSTDIAEVVLERWITTVDRHSSVASLRSAAESGAFEWGLPIMNEDGRRAQQRRELSLVMEALQAAVQLVSGNGALPELISAASLTVLVIGRTLGVKVAQAYKIADGTAGVDIVQARALAPLLQRDVDEVLGSNPTVDDGLVTAVTRLSVRPRLEQLGAQDRLDQSAALTELTRGALALAARKEGETTAWDARVDLYFQAKLGDRL